MLDCIRVIDDDIIVKTFPIAVDAYDDILDDISTKTINTDSINDEDEDEDEIIII
jgi:hypothetical protein